VLAQVNRESEYEYGKEQEFEDNMDYMHGSADASGALRGRSAVDEL
jgi:hypothetical protein